MDTNKRNELTLSFENLAWWTIHRNAPLLHALGLEYNDVFQDLMIAAMFAIEGFNPKRSESLFTHVRCQMQYAILRMRRQHKPCGMTGARKVDVTIVSICAGPDYAHEANLAAYDDVSHLDVADMVALLDAHERKAVRKKAAGHTLCRNAEKQALQSARHKAEALYHMDLQYA